MTETKWMYAFFPEETVFYGITADNKRVKMLIRKDTLCKLQEVPKNVKSRTGREKTNSR